MLPLDLHDLLACTGSQAASTRGFNLMRQQAKLVWDSENAKRWIAMFHPLLPCLLMGQGTRSGLCVLPWGPDPSPQERERPTRTEGLSFGAAVDKFTSINSFVACATG